MANFDDFKQKAGETASYIADASLKFARLTAHRARILAKIARIKSEVASEKESIKKTCLKMGREYYGLFKDSPDERLAQYCEMITMGNDLVETKLAEIEELKEEMKDYPASKSIRIPQDIDDEEGLD